MRLHVGDSLVNGIIREVRLEVSSKSGRDTGGNLNA
jgi:hypothetical protein